VQPAPPAPAPATSSSSICQPAQRGLTFGQVWVPPLHAAVDDAQLGLRRGREGGRESVAEPGWWMVQCAVTWNRVVRRQVPWAGCEMGMVAATNTQGQSQCGGRNMRALLQQQQQQQQQQARHCAPLCCPCHRARHGGRRQQPGATSLPNPCRWV
jgi:hypothetical protein